MEELDCNGMDLRMKYMLCDGLDLGFPLFLYVFVLRVRLFIMNDWFFGA